MEEMTPVIRKMPHLSEKNKKQTQKKHGRKGGERGKICAEEGKNEIKKMRNIITKP